MKGMNYMYYGYKSYPYYVNPQMYDPNQMYYDSMYNPNYFNPFMDSYFPCADEMGTNDFIQLKDYGPEPFAVNIEKASKQNKTFRTALWTGDYLQVTLMSIDVGEDIGFEVHHDLDQFIRIEEGQGIVKMGDRKDNLDFQAKVSDDFAFIIPAGKWHNLINTGNIPIKLYSIYAPPQHPRGTIHKTKADAEAAEKNHCY